MEKSGKRYFYTIAVCIVLLAGMYFWKISAVKNVQKKIEVQRIEIIEKSQQIITENTQYFLRLTTTPLVWAIRKEMIRDNYEQINEYMSLFVKEPKIKQILVADSEGVIAAATDKKLEGVVFSYLYPEEYLGKSELEIINNSDGNIIITSPIMGLNNRLGTLLMVYEPEKVNIEVTE